MEAAGIEPASRDVSEGASTCIVDRLIFAGTDSDRQDSATASSEVFSPIPFQAAGTDQPTVFARSH